MSSHTGPERAFAAFAAGNKAAIEERLASALPSDEAPLSSAMRAALLSPGKRIRALVALAAGEMFRGDRDAVLTFGASVEAVHAASLVLDDLPSMDDAMLRRGARALHLVFGESTAILAALALVNRAFEIIGTAERLPPGIRARLVSELAAACGEQGCCGGQEADLASDPVSAGLDELESIHARKTGALFVVAARGGAIAGRASEGEIDALGRYAKNLGLAFQIVDDILEETVGPDSTGKRAHGEGHRANFARILGVPAARTIAAELTGAAAAAISAFGRRGQQLSDLALALAERTS